MSQVILGVTYMDNIFECNIENFKKKNVENVELFICDNFYKNPFKILEIINNNNADFHKKEDKNTLNGKYFEDRRHSLCFDSLNQLTNKLSNITKQKCKESNEFLTNIMKFKKEKFNDFENNYWWPHKDKGMTAILYLNEENIDGTNIYQENEEQIKIQNFTKEHLEPWRNKKFWNKKYTIQSKFNRCVIFNGLDIHGCAITNETYFNKYRVNQVIFFEK